MPEIPLVMPKMSMTMTEGIFVAWHKQPGDAVRSGDVVAEVTTDKVDMEVESPIDGVLARLVAEPEDVVPVGEPIAFLTSETDDLLGDLLGGGSDSGGGAAADEPAAGGGGDTAVAAADIPAAATVAAAETGESATARAGSADPAAPADRADDREVGDGGAADAEVDSDAEDVAPVDSPQVETPPTTQADPPAAATPPTARSSTPPPSRPATSRPAAPSSSARSSAPSSPSGNGWVASVPLARTRAKELGVDLHAVTPTGPGGVVRVADVEAAPSGERSASASWRHQAVESASTTATGVHEAEDRARLRRRAALAKRMTESASVPQFVVFRDLDLDDLAAARDGVSWTAVLLTAYAAVLRDDPVLHARWTGERRQPYDEVVVSVAVDAPDGLLAPSIAAPDRMSLREVDDALRALAARAREGRLSVADLTPGTTTVSNLGGLGVDAFTVLLSPPQATALSLGAVGPVPVAVPGGLGVRVRCRAGLAVDHRVADGADAARLLQRLQDRCADPSSLGL